MKKLIFGKILILLAFTFCGIILFGCDGRNDTEKNNSSDEIITVDISKYCYEIEDEKYLKERISNATKVYYKSTADGEYGIEDAIFERTLLPDGYIEVEYVESNGRQFIDTGVLYADDLSLDLVFSEYTTDALSGSVIGTDGYLFTLCRTDSEQIAWLGSEDSIIGYNHFSMFKKYSVHCETNRFVINGEDGFTIPNPIVTNNSHNIWIFKGANGYASCKLYGLTITKSSQVIRDFIPCFRESDHVEGLYDIVNGKFYEPQSTNADLTIEYYKDLPDEYTQVEYIEGLGNQYADTGIRVNWDDVIEMDMKYQFTRYSLWGGSNCCIQYIYDYFNTNDMFDMHIEYEDIKESVYKNGTIAFEWYMPELKEEIGEDIIVGIFRLGDKDNTWFCYDPNVYPNTNEVVCQYAKMYSMSLIVNGELVLDLVPCIRNEDCVTGCYDKVTRRFIEVAGCDYGIKIENPEDDIFAKNYDRLEYVYFNGQNSGFSTGTKGYLTYAFDVKFENATYKRMLMGYSVNSGAYWGINGQGEYESYFKWSNLDNEVIIAGDRNVIVDKYTKTNLERYISGNRVFYLGMDKTSAYDCENNYYQVGSLRYLDGTNMYCCSMWFFGLEVKDGDTVIRDYVPARRKCDNAEGVYDMVGGEFIVIDNAEKKLAVGKPVGHVFDDGKVISELSESQNGEILYTCKICGKTYYEMEERLSYKVDFYCDEGVESIIVYKGYDYSSSENTSVAYTRNRFTNNYSKINGEVRFAIKLKDGYTLTEISPTYLENVSKEQETIYIISEIYCDTEVKIITQHK